MGCVTAGGLCSMAAELLLSKGICSWEGCTSKGIAPGAMLFESAAVAVCCRGADIELRGWACCPASSLEALSCAV